MSLNCNRGGAGTRRKTCGDLDGADQLQPPALQWRVAWPWIVFFSRQSATSGCPLTVYQTVPELIALAQAASNRKGESVTEELQQIAQRKERRVWTR
jgi:hypothetical protein